MQTVSLKEALEILEGEQWVKLSCLTADLVKNTGGKVVHYLAARIARRKTLEQSGAATVGSSDMKRPANHNLNFTRNIELKNGQIRKIHPILIFSIENMKVV
jgi:hypothetical protein